MLFLIFITVYLHYPAERGWALDGDYGGIGAVMYYDPVSKESKPFFRLVGTCTGLLAGICR